MKLYSEPSILQAATLAESLVLLHLLSAASRLPPRLSGERKAKMRKGRTHRAEKVVGLQQTFSL